MYNETQMSMLLFVIKLGNLTKNISNKIFINHCK